VTQDCFFKAHRGWAGFRGDANVQTWLLQIAVNLVRDVARSRRLQFWKRAHREAVDETGLTGGFAFEFRLPGDGNRFSGAALSKPWERQFALKLTPKRQSVEVLVIEHAARRPRAN